MCTIWLLFMHYQLIHKGRTIQKVILSISEHPFQFTRVRWEGLYVALSRVRKKDDIRLLLRFNDRSTMDYIINLEKIILSSVSLMVTRQTTHFWEVLIAQLTVTNINANLWNGVVKKHLYLLDLLEKELNVKIVQNRYQFKISNDLKS